VVDAAIVKKLSRWLLHAAFTIATGAALATQGGIVEVIAADEAPSPRVMAAVQSLADTAVARLAPSFPGLTPSRFQLFVHRDASSVPDDVKASLQEGAAGLAWLPRCEVHVLLDRVTPNPPGDLETVVRHETVHILLHQYAGLAGPFVPRWLHEGLAQILAGGTYLGVTEEDIFFYARTNNLLSFTDLRDRFPRSPEGLRTAYAQSFSFVSYLRDRVGLPTLLRAAQRCAADVEFDRALLDESGVSLEDEHEAWREYLNSGGARWRILLSSCFGLTMIAALPLLVLAARRKWNRDYASRRNLELVDADDELEEADLPERTEP